MIASLLIWALAASGLAGWLLRQRLGELARERNFYRAELYGRVGVRSVPDRDIAPLVKQALVHPQTAVVETPLTHDELQQHQRLQRAWTETDWLLFREHIKLNGSALPLDEATELERWVNEYGSRRPSDVFALGAEVL